METLDRCVFANKILDKTFTVSYATQDGYCWAQAGDQMDKCCYTGARRLKLLGEGKYVEQKLSEQVGESRRTKSRREAIAGALHSTPEKQT